MIIRFQASLIKNLEEPSGMEGKREGDIFNQRRATARQQTQQKIPPYHDQSNELFEKRNFNSSENYSQQKQEKRTHNRMMPHNRGGVNDNVSKHYNNEIRNVGMKKSSMSKDRDYYREQRPSNRNRGRDLSNYSLEQGKIQTLTEKGFGFIYCANRPSDMFFHYSETKGNLVDFKVGEEVQFYIAPSRGGISHDDEEKLSAYSVSLLEEGTVQWMVEEEGRKQGKVLRAIRKSGGRLREKGNDQANEGTIQLCNSEVAGEQNGAHSKSLIRFSASDYDGESTLNPKDAANDGDLEKGDIIEFTIVISKRDGRKYARAIALIQSERKRQEEEYEAKLLESASLEQGVVLTLKNGFGFLKSNRRKKKVYFEYSHVLLPDDGKNSNDDGEEEYTLAENQDVEFLVVTEKADPRKGGKWTLSARKIKFVEKGSVVFQQMLAKGVTGVITSIPQSPSNSGLGCNSRNRQGREEANGIAGKVLLNFPITFKPLENKDSTSIKISEVILEPSNSPGGFYSANRDGTRVIPCTQVGDTILFDVMRDIADNRCCVVPTKFISPMKNDDSILKEDEVGVQKECSNQALAKVRLLSLSQVGRAEGVINAIKDNFGFVLLAERNAEAYFRLCDILPFGIHEDLAMNDSSILKSSSTSAEAFQGNLSIGTKVSFDLSLQAPQGNHNGNRNRNGRQQSDIENVRAQRLVILTPSSVMLKKMIISGVEGLVLKEGTHMHVSGLLELNLNIKGMTLDERHPFVAKMLDSIELSGSPVIFREPQSEKENQVIIQMVDERGGVLRTSYIPTASSENRNGQCGRLKISKVTEDNSTHSPDESNQTDETSSEVADHKNENILSCEPDSNEELLLDEKKKKTKSGKLIKNMHYDKHSISSKNNGGPPQKGDRVSCDLFQCRRTGIFSVSDIKVIERKMLERGMKLPNDPAHETTVPGDGNAEPTKCGVGFVSKIVPSRQFGFISCSDQNNIHREKLFFHMKHAKEIDGSENTLIRKGDEVTFDIEIGKNGKLNATNVVTISNSPGAINRNSKGDKTVSQGYILMAPSHTSFINTPSHVLQNRSPSKTNGRWDTCIKNEYRKTSEVSRGKEEGYVLCLPNTVKPSNTVNVTNLNTSQSNNLATEQMNESAQDCSSSCNELSNDALPQAPVKENTEKCIRLSYSNGMGAAQGIGSSPGAGKSFKASAPKRGDLVSFIKGKGGRVRDVTVIKHASAEILKGTLTNININEGKAKFNSLTKEPNIYEISLSEVISCNIKILNEKDSVEGIFHDGSIFGGKGICLIF